MSTNEQLADRHWRSRRAFEAPNHHLWNNNGTWWIHYTVHHGLTKERVRQSLGTRCLEDARRKRDALFQAFALLQGTTRPEPFLSTSTRSHPGGHRNPNV